MSTALRSLLLACALSATVAADLPHIIDLENPDPAPMLRILGAQADDQIGMSLAHAGDWNGDGVADLLVGSPEGRDPLSGQVSGLAHLIFGSSTPPPEIDLGSPGGPVVIFHAEAAGDQLGFAVAGIGDWSGDGIDDIAIGAPFAQPGGSIERGRVYVVFGRSGPGPSISLATLASDEGVVISGEAGGDRLGSAIASAGDWNADGHPDLAIGSPNADFGAVDAGRVYILFGGDPSAYPMSLSSLPASRGAVIDGAGDSGTVPPLALFGDSLGVSLAGGHDLTGDGIDDLLLSAPGADPGPDNAGIAYLVAGSTSPEALIDLALPMPGVTSLPGIAEDDQAMLVTTGGGLASALFGGSVASPGDFDADGVGDLAIASHFADPTGESAGEAHMVLGGNDLGGVFPLAAAHATVRGAAEGDLLGRSLVGVGDVNGDGFPDLALGSPFANSEGRADAGELTLLFGSPHWPRVFQLPAGPPFALRVLGGEPGDTTGLSAAGAGDWDADGFWELAVGSPHARPSPTRSEAGVVTIIRGDAFAVPVSGVEAWGLYR